MKIGNVIPAKAGIQVLVMLFALPLFALADPTINARLSASQIALNESATLTIEISGVSDLREAPNLNLPDFQVQNAGQTSSYQFVNGQTSSMVTFNYVLTPTRTGTLTIPALTLQNGGNSYTTQPLTLVVTSSPQNSNAQAPTQQAPAGDDSVPSEGLRPVFMTAKVDKSKTYVGQQVLLTVQFLRRPNIALAAQPRYREPDMTGFVVEPLKQQEYTTNFNGIPYVVTELRYALFPTTDGDFAIGNASIDVGLRSNFDPFDPNSIFQNFFNQGQMMKLNTRAIPIQVRALPKSKPDGFSGAVGRFKISAKVDSNTPEVGKPFNLIVKIEGVGNIKAIREPVIPEMRSFRRYETLSDTKINTEGKFVYGSKEFKVLLIPQVSGSVSIPPLSFSYFNPDQHQYVSDTTSAISLQVKPGNLSASNPDRPSVTGTVDQAEQGIHVVEKDIRFIKSGKIRPLRMPLGRNIGFWLLGALPPLFALTAAITVFQSRRRQQRAGFYRSKEALSRAKKDLKKAKKLLNDADSNPFYGSLYAALVGYLANKLGLSASGVVWKDIEERLLQKNVDDELRTRVREIWDETDMARFGITTFSIEDKQKSLVKTEDVLTRLNKLI